MSPQDRPGEGSFADDAHRYRLESRIATGGMGEVWRATDTTLGRTVAVKLLKHEYADDPAFRGRFETEARHAAALHHPGIAAVFDFGEAAATAGSPFPRPYLVMELVDGQPLSALLRPGQPMEPGVAADLMAQAADALAAAHAAGIVHRDVKPANLMVTPERKVKVTDFGIARAADGVGITQTGQVLGTPQYLSPEQARGNPATAASDVYALGVVAFECLAGRRPFEADSPVATALAHLHQPVPELPTAVPAPLAGVVRRALAKEPGERFDSASSFAAALREPGAAGVAEAATAVVAPVPTPPPAAESTSVLPPVAPVPTPLTSTTTSTTTEQPSGRRSAWVAALLVITLVAVLVLIAVLLLGGGDEQPTDTPSSTPPTSESTTPSDTPSDTPSTTAPATVEVNADDYTGRDYREVQADLKSLNLGVTLNELTNDGSHEAGIVDSINPTGTLTEGDTVTVSYWGPAADTSSPSPSDSATPSDSPTDTTTSPAAGTSPSAATSSGAGA